MKHYKVEQFIVLSSISRNNSCSCQDYDNDDNYSHNNTNDNTNDDTGQFTRTSLKFN